MTWCTYSPTSTPPYRDTECLIETVNMDTRRITRHLTRNCQQMYLIIYSRSTELTSIYLGISSVSFSVRNHLKNLVTEEWIYSSSTNSHPEHTQEVIVNVGLMLSQRRSRWLNIGNQMNQKELTKTFVMILN